MTADCVRCGGSNRNTKQWEVVSFTERPGERPRAYLRCRVCGNRFSSQAPDAVEAGRAFAAARGDAPIAAPCAVPAPSLFGGALPKQSQGFVKAGAGIQGRSAQDVVDAIRRVRSPLPASEED